MKIRSYLIIGLLIFPFLTAFSHTNRKIDKKVKQIKLATFDEKPFFAYENLVSIIYLDKSLVIESIKKRLEDSQLCEKRRKNYSLILNDLSKNDSSFYTINSAHAITEETKDIDKITGFFPLDYYSKLLCLNITKNYIAPHGYKVLMDTTKLIPLKKYYDWMISDLVLQGQAKVFNKNTGKYEKEVKYEVVHFDGLHGGEQLQFTDNSLFFIVESYSDVIMDDGECDEENEQSFE